MDVKRSISTSGVVFFHLVYMKEEINVDILLYIVRNFFTHILGYPYLPITS